MTRLRARFDGKVLVPLEPVDLPQDRPLDIDVWEASEMQPGSPTLLLKRMHEPPHVPVGVVDELERAIESGKSPVRFDSVFDDLTDGE